MSHQAGTLSEEDVKDILQDLVKQIKEALNCMEKVQNWPTLSQKIVDLELGVVSPLYYRLQKNLIDWGTWDHHHNPFGERLKLYEGKKFDK